MASKSTSVKSPNFPTITPGTSLHHAARLYAKNNIPIFPCVPFEKKPITKNGFLNATTDLEQIDKWWTEHPDANIAFSPASVNQGVIDLDGAEGMTAWFDLGYENDTPVTYTVRTPRGGLHLYYAAENFPTTGYAPGRKRCVGEHIDTRGKGGYVLLPPSVTEHGTYEVIDDREPVPMPAWLIKKLEPTAKPLKNGKVALDLPSSLDKVRRMLAAYVRRGHVAIEGEGGNNRTFNLACEVLDFGLSPEKAIEALAEHWNGECSPPWSNDELRTIVENAERYQQNEPGSKATPPLKEAFEHVAKSGNYITSDNGRRFEHTTGRHYPPEQTKWLFPHVLPYGAITLIGGHGGLGKSSITIDLAVRMSQAKEWPGGIANTNPPMEFVYFGSEQNIKRSVMPKWLGAGGDPDHIHMLRSTPDERGQGYPFNLREDIGTLTALIEHLRKQGRSVGAVGLDPLNSYIGEIDASRNNAVRSVLTPLAEWSERLDVAIWGIGHTTKGSNSGEAVLRFLDSRAYTDLARGVYMVGRDPDNPMRNRAVGFAKGNEGQNEGGITFQVIKDGAMIKNWKTGEEFGAPIVRWGATWNPNLTANAIMAVSDNPSRSEKAKTRQQEIAELLVGLLKGQGWQRARPIIGKISLAGHRLTGEDDPILYRARLVARVVSKQHKGQFYWCLEAEAGDGIEAAGVTPFAKADNPEDW